MKCSKAFDGYKIIFKLKTKLKFQMSILYRLYTNCHFLKKIKFFLLITTLNYTLKTLSQTEFLKLI